jgi:3-hydroxymyristoyl/3-hydroxydecanoyl-(acyl carrier protein) dehydratase
LVVIVAPEIRSVERTSSEVRLHLTISPELRYFDGHFHGCPLLPGIVQVNWAIELGRTHFAIPARFRGLRGVKFMRVILPAALVTLRLEYATDKSALGFAYEFDGGVYSSGTVLFDLEQ